jgi:microcystin-dependent protein
MAQPFIGEIRMFAGNFAPAGWAFCNGAPMPISENDTLFALIGTTYGGDGQSTFNLPDLRGRIPIHQGNGFILAETGGVEDVTLTTSQIPAHGHPLVGSNVNGSQAGPSNALLASSVVITPYAPEVPGVSMAATSIGVLGGSQPHINLQPFLCVNFIISLFGIFPPPP